MTNPYEYKGPQNQNCWYGKHHRPTPQTYPPGGAHRRACSCVRYTAESVCALEEDKTLTSHHKDPTRLSLSPHKEERTLTAAHAYWPLDHSHRQWTRAEWDLHHKVKGDGHIPGVLGDLRGYPWNTPGCIRPGTPPAPVEHNTRSEDKNYCPCITQYWAETIKASDLGSRSVSGSTNMR